MPPSRKRIPPDKYKLAVHTYFMEHTIRSVSVALGISYKVARRLVKEGDESMGYAPVEKAIENYDPREGQTSLVPVDEAVVTEDREVAMDVKMVKAYRGRVAKWLAKPSDPEGIPIKVRDLKALIDLRRDIEGETRGNVIINLPYENMTDVEWDRLVTGKGKPKR